MCTYVLDFGLRWREAVLLYTTAVCNPIFPKAFVEQTRVFPWIELRSLVEESLAVRIRAHFYSVPLIFFFVSVPVLDWFDYNYSVVCLEVEIVTPLALFFFFKKVLANQGLLCLQMNSPVIFSISTKNAVRILEIVLNHYITFPMILSFIQNSTSNTCWHGFRLKCTLIHCWLECKLVWLWWKSIWRVMRQRKIDLLDDPAILFQAI